ncbi:MAG: hypothetical protein WBO45_20745 [Planctomycetota bacterium]
MNTTTRTDADLIRLPPTTTAPGACPPPAPLAPPAPPKDGSSLARDGDAPRPPRWRIPTDPPPV